MTAHSNLRPTDAPNALPPNGPDGRHRRDRRTSIVVLSVVGLFVLGGCAADRSDAVAGIAWNPDSRNSVSGFEQEWLVQSDHESINAGTVNFTFANTGKIVHEVVLIRTDDAPGQIPVDAKGRLNEDDPNSLNVGETEEMDPGKTVTFTETLPPGHYQLVCNIAGHYGQGMYVPFTVH